jgi:hypothetical protein
MTTLRILLCALVIVALVTAGFCLDKPDHSNPLDTNSNWSAVAGSLLIATIAVVLLYWL